MQSIIGMKTSTAFRFRRIRAFATTLAAVGVLTLADVSVDAREAPSPPEPPTRQAHARLDPAKGSGLRGHTVLGETDDGVNIVVHVIATERGKRQVSLMRDGGCKPSPDPKRKGSRRLGTVEIDEDGRGTLEVELPRATLGPDKRSLIGHAIVVHNDDVVACGAVRRPNGK